MLNRPFFIYWARVFMAGTIGELILRIFYLDYNYTPLNALVVSFAIAGIFYLIDRKPFSKSELLKKSKFLNHPIANYFVRNFLVFSIVSMVFVYVFKQPKMLTSVMLVVSFMLAMIHYFTMDRKTEENKS